jgi:hypothetical protein
MRQSLAAAALAASLALGACDYDPRGRCASAADCLAGQVCAGGVCGAAVAGPADRAPVAAADAFVVPRNGTLNVPAGSGVLANDSDPDGDPLTAALVSGPSYGVAFLAPDGSLTYEPATGFVGVDSLSYRATDGVLWSDVTEVTITVGP